MFPITSAKFRGRLVLYSYQLCYVCMWSIASLQTYFCYNDDSFIGSQEGISPFRFHLWLTLGCVIYYKHPKAVKSQVQVYLFHQMSQEGNLNKVVLTTWFPLSVSFIYWIFLTFFLVLCTNKSCTMYIKLLFLCTFFSCFQWRGFYTVKDRDLYKLSNKLSHWKTKFFLENLFKVY